MGCCRCSPRLPTLLLREAAALLGRWGAGRPTWPEGRVPDARCVSGSYASHQLPGSWAPSSPVGVTVEVLYMPLGSFSGTGSTGSWAPTILVRGGGRAGFAQVSGQVPARYTCVHARPLLLVQEPAQGRSRGGASGRCYSSPGMPFLHPPTI